MMNKLLLTSCIGWAALLAPSAQAKTTTVFFSSGDGGGRIDPLPSLSGLQAIEVQISFVSTADGRPNTDIPGNYDLTTTMVGDATILGVTLPTSVYIQDQGVITNDDLYYDQDCPQCLASTYIDYKFTKADLITARANGSKGSKYYGTSSFTLSGTAVNTDTNASVDWLFYGLNDASIYNSVIITTPEPAMFALFGVGVLGIALRRR